MFSHPLSYPLTVLVVVVAARRPPPPPPSSLSTSCSLLSTSEARFPPFHHHRHCSKCCWRRARLLPSMLKVLHPLIIAGIVPAVLCPPVVFLLSSRPSALCSLPGHALSHLSVIIAPTAVQVTTGTFCIFTLSLPALIVIAAMHGCQAHSPLHSFPAVARSRRRFYSPSPYHNAISQLHVLVLVACNPLPPTRLEHR